jgi:fibronectin-binding autotransporter adhesin
MGVASMGIVSTAAAQITEFGWTGGTGAKLWQQNGNWNQTGFPNDSISATPSLHVANTSIPLASNLTLDVGTAGNNVMIAGITLGGTSAGVTTNITSSGALLQFQNGFVPELGNADFDNDTDVDGRDFLIWQRGFGLTAQLTNANGDADADGTVTGLDLGIWGENFGENANSFNAGRGFIISNGVAAAVNRISAPIRLVEDSLDVLGTRNLTVDGEITFFEAAGTLDTLAQGFNNTSAGITTTVNGNISLINQADGMAGEYGLNTSDNAQGTLVVNGIVSDGGLGGDLWIGVGSNNARFPLNTVRINTANTYGGGTTIRRTNLEIADNASLGTGTITQRGPANQFGYNLIAVGGDRTIANNFRVAQWQTFKGQNSITLTGNITQTNNRGFVNQLDAGKTLNMTGLLEIWEDDEALTREFEIDGSGTTLFTGIIRDDPMNSGGDRRIRKSGTGVLTIDVNAGDNMHAGPTLVAMGNFHYADNDSLNVGSGLILARGGAVGVDTGVASNATFANKIDSRSTGGLMLAPSDAAANLNFTSTLANAANMTVAAPETGLTYTGTITPANSVYQLGGGTGTLTLPNAQLVGANRLEVRNGGTVELLGDNTYSGTTRISTKYTSSHQEQAAANSSNANDATGLFYDRLVAPVLAVDKLANGGVASSLGTASSDAANLFIQGSTLKYIGAGDSTDRLFTIGTGGATLDASGTGAVVFSNTGMVGRADAADRSGTLDDFSGQPNEIVELGDTSDLIVGMSVSDPDGGGTFTQPPCEPGGANCIPAGTTITGISDDGGRVGLSNSFPFILKENTRIVFGTVERTLKLAGTSTADNTLASVIADSPAGGVVAIDKVGPGKWVLTGSNSYSGDTTVEAGTLSISNPFLSDAADIRLSTGAILDLAFAGADVVDDLFFDGVAQSKGTWGRIGHPTATFKSAFFTGEGLLNVGGVAALGALAGVPEPSTLVLCLLASLARGRRPSTGRRG